jgi:GNAT superfamily N-acetyltransferase
MGARSVSTRWRFVQATIEDYYPYWDDARRNFLRPDPKTPFYAVRDDEVGTILGLCGLVITGTTAVFKSDYVPPEHRGKGVWRRMFDERMQLCRAAEVTRVRANATPMILNAYLRRGAQIAVSYKSGITRLWLPV